MPYKKNTQNKTSNPYTQKKLEMKDIVFEPSSATFRQQKMSGNKKKYLEESR